MRSFNPRARDGRDFDGSYITRVGMVSIHAPVMDAISAQLAQALNMRFNPRARDGRD